jgi:hypothetical protein
LIEIQDDKAIAMIDDCDWRQPARDSSTIREKQNDIHITPGSDGDSQGQGACESQRKCTLSCHLRPSGNKIAILYAAIGTHLVTGTGSACASSELAQVGFRLRIYQNPSDPHQFELQQLGTGSVQGQNVHEPSRLQFISFIGTTI